jgi:hypothetical protein
MKTKSQITYIFLDRGVEDVALLEELCAIYNKLKVKSRKDFVASYPKVDELIEGLAKECEGG